MLHNFGIELYKSHMSGRYLYLKQKPSALVTARTKGLALSNLFFKLLFLLYYYQVLEEPVSYSSLVQNIFIAGSSGCAIPVVILDIPSHSGAKN